MRYLLQEMEYLYRNLGFPRNIEVNIFFPFPLGRFFFGQDFI